MSFVTECLRRIQSVLVPNACGARQTLSSCTIARAAASVSESLLFVESCGMPCSANGEHVSHLCGSFSHAQAISINISEHSQTNRLENILICRWNCDCKGNLARTRSRLPPSTPLLSLTFGDNHLHPPPPFLLGSL